MDFYTSLFWIGFLIMILIHIRMLLAGHMRQHAIVALTGAVFMFVGSKIGREFLGIS